MADSMNTKTLNAFLAKPEDWTDWSHEFTLLTQTYQLEDHFTKKTPLLNRPIMPDIRQKRYTKKPHLLRNARSQTISEDENDEDTIQDKANGMWMMTDLTEAGVKAFNLDLAWTKQLETSYNREYQAVKEITRWMMQTISPTYKTTCCPGGVPLWQWYQNLQDRCGQTSADEKMELRSQYKLALKPPKNNRDALTWIDKWESTMARGSQKGLVETQDTSAWVPDLLQAVKWLLPVWAATYKQVNKGRIADGSLTFREIGNDLRQEFAVLDSHKARAKGAFATTYDGKDHGSNGDAQAAEDHILRRRGATGSHGGRGGIKRTQTERSERSCPACEMPHALANCYYVFPDKAYDGFKPRGHLQDKVEKALENDADLQSQVRTIKGPRSKSKSKTPRPTKEEVTEEIDD